MVTSGFEASIFYELNGEKNGKSLFFPFFVIHYPGVAFLTQKLILYIRINSSHNNNKKNAYSESLPTTDLFAIAITFSKIKHDLVFTKKLYMYY